jgi:hypothetical protein
MKRQLPQQMSHLPLDPRYKKIDNSALPPGGNLGSAWYFPPPYETVATTTGASMLRLEHMVSAHRRVLPVVRRIYGGEARSDEVPAMGADRLQPLSAIYFLSTSDRWNRMRNLDFANREKAAS